MSLQSDLAQFSGTEEHYRWSKLFRNTLLTDGTKYLADKAGAYWLMDIIGSVQRKLAAEDFQTWTLRVKNCVGKVVCDDGNGRVLYKQDVPYTDFPLSEIKLYACREDQFTIPAAALKELARILPDTNEPLSLYRPKDRAQAAFRLADIELTAQLMEGNFPDYAAILPKSTKLKVLVDTQAFLTACRQVEVIAREGDHVAKLVFTPETEGRGRLMLSAQSDETGSSEIELALEKLEGPDLTMAFNVRYLRAVLEAMRGPKLRFEANAHNAPAVILPQNGEEVLYLVMPMH